MSKLLTFQQRVEAIKKDSQNPFFKSSYLSLNGLLDAIKPLLNELELVLIQPLSNVDGRPSIKTVIIDKDLGEIQSSEITLPDLQDPQKMGSAITYYRRYAIQSMLLLQAEDDDSNLASNKFQPGTLGKGLVNSALVSPVTKAKSKNEIIASLCKKLGLEGTTRMAYDTFVFGHTTLTLREENYDKIITKLESLINNK